MEFVLRPFALRAFLSRPPASRPSASRPSASALFARPVVVVVLCATLAGVLSATPASAATSAVDVEVRLTELANAERARAGVHPLRVDVRLVAPAREWSGEMARRGELAHGGNVQQETPAGATAWGENVGTTREPDAAEALHRAFMQSDTHRRAILNGAYTEVGIGVVVSGDRVWVTQRFSGGAPASVSRAVVATAQLAQDHFAGGRAAHVVLVRDDQFPDALAAGPLAGMDGPLLLTPPGPVTHPWVHQAIQRTLPAGGTVTIVGGANALPSAIDEELRAAGWAVRRISGRDRVEAAAGVARALAQRARPDTVLLATAADWPDAAAGSAFGARVGAPILLVHRDSVPELTARALHDLRPSRIIALGGASVISDAVVAQTHAIRVASITRQGTAAAVAREVWGRRDARSTPRWAVVPDSSDAWPWALAAAPAAARLDAPLLLAGDPVQSPLRDYLRGLAYDGPAHADLMVYGPVDAPSVREIAALVD